MRVNLSAVFIITADLTGFKSFEAADNQVAGIHHNTGE